MARVLIVEDKDSLAQMLRETLETEGFAADTVRSAELGAKQLAQGQRYDAVLTDLRLPGASGIDFVSVVKASDPECPVIVMTGYGTVADAVEAMKRGADDFVQKPIDIDHLLLVLRRSTERLRLRRENLLLRSEFQERYGLPAIVGESVVMKELSESVRKVAATDTSVLLLGESGTGKELFARAVHALSPRRDRPFVAINCAAIPETLLENELFGHERGAFTGASSRQIGKFEMADEGTIFLDEIGELGFGVQSKLLRVLQERRFQRIGGQQEVRVDVRIVCATNRDLAACVKAGSFREDLYYRINVVPLTVPPLRDRPGDLDQLIDFFLARSSRDAKRSLPSLTAGARQMMNDYRWPGNIRELQNSIERAVILSDSAMIGERDLSLPPEDRGASARELTARPGESLADAGARVLANVERKMIQSALAETHSRAEAAGRLGISQRTLAAKIKEYGLDEVGR